MDQVLADSDGPPALEHAVRAFDAVHRGAKRRESGFPRATIPVQFGVGGGVDI